MSHYEPKGSFIRWQSTTIAQLTYAVNLILSFSVATLGFQVAILQNDNFVPVSLQKCAFSLSLLLVILSVVFGILCVINRLYDFRISAKVARMREDGKSDEEMQSRRMLCKNLGKKTWALFCLQIGTFSVGIIFLIITIIANFGGKLL